MKIRRADSADDLAAVAALFVDYAASLPVDLGYQGFAAELAGLLGNYAAPRGALLLATDDAGAPLGCVGLRPLSVDGACEMKRLYLRLNSRGLGLGRALAEAVVAEARRCGYRELCLDTLPTMARAIAMYREMGFVSIAPYYAPTPTGTVFLALTLEARRMVAPASE